MIYLLVAGAAYLSSFQAAINSPNMCTFPQEYPGMDDPGRAYQEARDAAEDSDCHNDYEKEEAPEWVG